MQRRRRQYRHGFEDALAAEKQLADTFDGLKLSRRLTKRQSDRLAQATAVRTGQRTVPKTALKQQRFLNKIFNIRPGFFELCAVAFTQQQIDSTKKGVLNELVERIKKRQDATIVHQFVQSLIPDPQDTTAGYAVELRHAEREGTRRVFGEYLVDKIKMAEMNTNWRAVSVVLPFYPKDLESNVIMSLEICAEKVKELAMALLMIEVDWATDFFRVVHADKTVQIIPHAEFEWMALSDKRILDVFGSYIYNVFAACRSRELNKGESGEDCVKIVFRGSECTIKLKMSYVEAGAVERMLFETAT